MGELAYALSRELTEYYTSSNIIASHYATQDCALGFSQVALTHISLIIWDSSPAGPAGLPVQTILAVIHLEPDNIIIRRDEEYLLQVDYCHPQFLELIVATLDTLIVQKRALDGASHE